MADTRATRRWANPDQRTKQQRAYKTWQQNNPNYPKHYNAVKGDAKSRYGLTASEIEQERLFIGERCQLSTLGNCAGDLVIDHCHRLNSFRGFLCRQHNAALGMLGDDIDELTTVLEYL